MYPPSLTPPPLPSLAGPHCPLQFNNFVGALPSNLSDLTHLIAFSCAQNALSGPIPSAPFSGFNPSAYSGNTGLCGPPLQPCSGTALPPPPVRIPLLCNHPRPRPIWCLG